MCGFRGRRMIPINDYLALVRNQARFLGFGFLLTFTSSAGQTYFIGVFGPEIRETFSLNHTQWGMIYLVGTLSSALVLPWSGQLIDRVNLRLYSVSVVMGLALGCVVAGLAPSALALLPAIFLLRQFGQGLTSHAAITSVIRHMGHARGKAIAIASMGYSFGEAVLPFLAVLAITVVGWRSAYLLTGLCVFAVSMAIPWFLRGHADGREPNSPIADHTGDGGSSTGIDKTRREMLSESRFYLLLPAVLAPSYISTALFFHHLTLAESKGWPGLWVTGNYWVFAVFSILTSLTAGPMIDKYSAARVVPFYLLPMVAGLLLLAAAGDPFWVVPYMCLIGINTGIYFTAINALWVELYGAKYLGAIKSLVGSLGVFASALGPITVGALLDGGFSFENVCVAFAAYCVVATSLLVVGLDERRRR